MDELAKLGEQLRINSTPTLFFSDGSRVPGAVDVERLEKKFSSLAAALARSAGK